MSGCRIKPQDKPDWTLHACGTDRVSCVVQSNPPPDPKLFSMKIFCIMATKFKRLGVVSESLLHCIGQRIEIALTSVVLDQSDPPLVLSLKHNEYNCIF